MKQISYDYSYIKGGSMLPLGKATAQGKLNLKKLAWPSLPRTYTPAQPPNHYYGIVKRRGEGLKTSSFFFVKRVAAAQSKLCIKTARKSQKAGSYIITLPLTPSPSHSQIYQHILNV